MIPSSDLVLKRIIRWRQICPELLIRLTTIVGFQDEIKEEF